ncbi:MAG: pyridoxal-phosphate-dependent aminotransferase family protein [Candidatus Zipacnadales bacterium]
MSNIPQVAFAPERILMGPGPSNCPPSVLTIMAQSTIGHLDPWFLQRMNEVQEMLRLVMGTQNRLTLPISATGSAGMETCLVNLIEPGDRCVVGINGVFGMRMSDIVERCGGELVRVEAPWGKPLDPEDVRAALQDGTTKLVAIVHAETSTGVLQPIEEIAHITHEHDALLVVDTVTSLGGHPVYVDAWGIDACYSGTQKCLSVPPGLSPVSFNDRAVAALRSRKSKVQSWYLDLNMICNYWGEERVYHHTAPVNMILALHEGLRLILEEGLEARWERHRRNHELLLEGLEEIGLKLFPAPEDSLWTLNALQLPPGTDDVAARRRMLEQFGIEIGGGLGELKGKIWRVGLMGHSSTARNVALFLAAAKAVL